ncbi:MAG: adenylate/guanylate cyclase domain-containing protein, partial [Gammaproteobacteria bacterium]
MRCLACGSECAPAARFCSECGERLRDPVLAAGSSERRQLTVMFCDLVDSTRLSLELDAEDFTNAISAYRDVCARVVTHWRGYVSRYVGDGVLAYFGYPRASDDDALRGVCAAWELLRGIAELRPALTSSVRGGAGLRLRARVGLHTGLAVVGDVVGRDSAESAGVLGAVPNIAARLQGFAQPGQVVVSDATATLLPASIRLGPLAGDTQPERIGPTRAYAVVDVPHDSARRRALSNATLLGRQAVIER